MITAVSPSGDTYSLPTGSTPIDFAYAVHLELGHECTGALVNGRSVPLTHPLQDNDIVQILKSQAGVGPSPDWLEVVQTKRARTAIRHWLREQEEAETAVPPANAIELLGETRVGLVRDITITLVNCGAAMQTFNAEQLADGTTRCRLVWRG